MRKLLTLLLILIITNFISACSTTESISDTLRSSTDLLPSVYKITVPQGNVLTQEVINQLRPGMDKRQVKFLLGTPLIADPFHKERWDYFYDLKVANKEKKRERLTVFFKNEKLVSLKGNFKPSNEFKPLTINTKVVDVPKRKVKEKGWFEKFLHLIGIEKDAKF